MINLIIIIIIQNNNIVFQNIVTNNQDYIITIKCLISLSKFACQNPKIYYCVSWVNECIKIKKVPFRNMANFFEKNYLIMLKKKKWIPLITLKNALYPLNIIHSLDLNNDAHFSLHSHMSFQLNTAKREYYNQLNRQISFNSL